MINAAGIAPGTPLVDIGGGASMLVDSLLERGFHQITVLDIAEAALQAARQRLGKRAGAVNWVAADLLDWQPPRGYGLWHDRAVFHFLTGKDDRAAYRHTLLKALPPGGQAIMATFAPDGPEKCSGLPVQRYDAAGLAASLGPAMRLIESERHIHITPAGAEQSFIFARFRREPE
jgi:trans-aconitate methyltransferase